MTKQNKNTVVEDIKTLPYFLLSFVLHNITKVFICLGVLFIMVFIVLVLSGS